MNLHIRGTKMRKLCAILLFAYSTAALPHGIQTSQPPPAPAPAPMLPNESHDNKLVPFLIGAALGAFLVIKFGKEPKSEPVLNIRSQPGDDR